MAVLEQAMNADRNRTCRTIALRHIRYAGTTLLVIAVAVGLGVAALWLASFFLCASLRMNPFHAGFHTWLDAALAWRDGRLPKDGRRLAGAALFGVLLAFGAPVAGVGAMLDRSARRRLYGSARFANEADIRRAGLL
nr:hypothetical protein [Burkholderia multivorans]